MCVLKRIVSISFVCAALVAVLAAYAVPHHHHDRMVCGVEFGGTLCDAPADGSSDAPCAPGNRHSDGDRCVAESEFIAPGSEDDASPCASGGCDHGDHGGYGVAALIATALFFTDPAFGAFGAVEVDPGEPSASYTSVDIAAAGPLRAPPATSC